MSQTIVITGATDGIGLETAKMLAAQGHTILIHGRNTEKLKKVSDSLEAISGGGRIQSYVSDLSKLANVEDLARDLVKNHEVLDVLINNAGVFNAQTDRTPDGLDIRFAVNTVAPYILTQRLLPLLGSTGRVVNLSSAAQASVDLEAMAGQRRLGSGSAYAQSKLALTMWSRHMALNLGDEGPMIVAVNPRSMLGTKMVKEAYGVNGSDLRIGADILVRAALSEEFSDASGKYFDNDRGIFSSPHPDALDPLLSGEVVELIEDIIAKVNR